jgi:hypothetical protein
LRKALDARQARRLRQIAWQAWGPWAFADPEVVAALKLTPAQKESVANTLSAFKAAEIRRFVRGGPRGDGGGHRDEEEKAPDPAESVATIVELLTPTQADAWSNLVGEPFTGVPYTNPAAWFFRGGRGGGGFGGGGFGHDRGGPGGPPDFFMNRSDAKPNRSTPTTTNPG